MVVASLHSLVSIMQKEKRENDKQRGSNIDKEKKMQLGAFKKQEVKVLIPFSIKRPCW